MAGSGKGTGADCDEEEKGEERGGTEAAALAGGRGADDSQHGAAAEKDEAACTLYGKQPAFCDGKRRTVCGGRSTQGADEGQRLRHTGYKSRHH